MAEINRTEKDQVLPGEDEKKSELTEASDLQKEEGEFDYEQRKSEIETRYEERMEGTAEKPGIKSMIKEIFGKIGRPGNEDGMFLYEGVLNSAIRKIERSKKEEEEISRGLYTRRPGIPPISLNEREELAMALYQKEKEIEKERDKELEELESRMMRSKRDIERKKQEDKIKRISEI